MAPRTKENQTTWLWLSFIVAVLCVIGCVWIDLLSHTALEAKFATYKLGLAASLIASAWSLWSLFSVRKVAAASRHSKLAIGLAGLGCIALVNSFIGLNALATGLTSPVINFVIQTSGVLTYLVWPIALFLLPARKSIAERKLPWLLDVALIIMAITAAGWFFLIAPQVDTSADANALWLRLIFPVVDLISAAAVVAAMSLGGPYRSARGVMMVAILVNATGDVIQSYDVARNLPARGNLEDSMWVGAVLLGGLAALLIKRESAKDVADQPSTSKPLTPDWVTAIIPAIFLGALVLLSFWGNWTRPHSIDTIGLNIGCLAELGLGLFRIVLIVKENGDLAAKLSRVNKSLDIEVQSRTRELSEARDELDQQRIFFRSVIDALPSLVFAISPDGTVSLANEAAAKFTGRTVTALQLSNFIDVMGEINPGAPSIITDEAARLLKGEKLEIAEREITSADRSNHVFEVVKTPLFGADGIASKILIVSNDITVRKEAERSLIAARDAAERATRVKSEFLATMSHEIRTPMNGVLGCAELLLNEKIPDQHREYVAAIKASGEQLLSIINDILDLSKLEAGQIDVQHSRTVLGDLCREVVDKHRGVAADKGINLRLEFLLDPQAAVMTDHERLRQVLGNLVSNAIKFTDAGGVTVEVTRTRCSNGTGSFVFAVQDTGVGIESDQLARIFEPFYQSDGAHSRRYGGTGLGLSLCRQFVRLLGSQVQVESTPGKGSRFWFELTCKVEEEAQTVKPVATDLVGLQVLLVEDNILNQKVAKKLLERLGCEVSVVNNGLEAVEWLLERRCDVVLMDCQMPVMDGLEATRRIRTFASPESAVPIIAVTANAMEGDREMCIAAGMDDYVPKPIKADELAGAIGRMTNRRSAA